MTSFNKGTCFSTNILFFQIFVFFNIILFSQCGRQNLGLSEGDVCKLHGNATWTCKKVSECLQIRGVKKSRSNCRSVGREPIVCCPQNGGRAVQKCKEYSDNYCIPMTASRVRRAVMRNVVVGGRPAKPTSHPHMALIGFGPSNKKQWLCGGSLISDEFILSAAHCSKSPTFGEAKWVRLGDLDTSSTLDNARPIDLRIVKIINHPKYKPPAMYNDISLYKLNQQVRFTRWIMPICLHTLNAVPGTKVLAAGWGRTDFVGPISTRLLEVDLNLINGTHCKSLLDRKSSKRLPKGVDLKTMICAGELQGGKDTCSGDSGGPLMARNNIDCLQTVIGIVSMGNMCGLQNSPGLYTKVSSYIPWIEKIVWPLV